MGCVSPYNAFLLILIAAPVVGQSLNFRVTFLGTAGPSMSIDRAEAGTLVQAGTETLLFDCGRGVPERLSQLGISNVNKIFLTHLHSDHTQGLPVLWMSAWNVRGMNGLSIWGPGTDVDVLIHEVFNAAVGSTAATAAYHTLPEQAADIFNRTAPKLAVYSHMAPAAFDASVRTRAAGYSGPLAVATDLSTIDIGDIFRLRDAHPQRVRTLRR